MRPLRLAAMVAIAAGSLALGACGGQSPKGSGEVQQLVSRDYGAQVVGDAPAAQPGANETLLGLLRQGFDVREAGGRVRAVDGQTGNWQVFVNGVRETDDP